MSAEVRGGCSCNLFVVLCQPAPCLPFSIHERWVDSVAGYVPRWRGQECLLSVATRLQDSRNPVSIYSYGTALGRQDHIMAGTVDGEGCQESVFYLMAIRFRGRLRFRFRGRLIRGSSAEAPRKLRGSSTPVWWPLSHPGPRGPHLRSILASRPCRRAPTFPGREAEGSLPLCTGREEEGFLPLCHGKEAEGSLPSSIHDV